MWGVSLDIIIFYAFITGIISLVIITCIFTLIFKRNSIDAVFKRIAQEYKLNYAWIKHQRMPEVTGVIEGAYLRMRVAPGEEFGALDGPQTVVISLVFELPIEAKVEIRRGQDYSNWLTPLPENKTALQVDTLSSNLLVYGTQDDALVLLSEIVQKKLIDLFSGDGEWRFHVARKDAEIMWRSSHLKVGDKRFYQVIDTMVRVEALFSEVPEMTKDKL